MTRYLFQTCFQATADSRAAGHIPVKDAIFNFVPGKYVGIVWPKLAIKWQHNALLPRRKIRAQKSRTELSSSEVFMHAEP
jgi:hypothetical protein